MRVREKKGFALNLHAHIREHRLVSESYSAHRADSSRAADVLGAVAAADKVAARENDVAFIISADDTHHGAVLYILVDARGRT